MKEELKQIGLELHKWAKKYNKDLVDVCVIDGNILANVKTDDKDYRELDMFIRDNEVENDR